MARTVRLLLGVCAASLLWGTATVGLAQTGTAPAATAPAEAAPADAAAASDTAETQSHSPESELHQAAAKFVEFYNAGDAEAIAALFAPEAEIVIRSGESIQGREAIQQAFADTFSGSPGAAISLKMDDLRFITDDVAVERGSTTYYPDGETATVESRYTVVHVRRDGGWMMVAARTVEEEVLTNYEHLRVLDWLVGDWVDEGADSVIESSYSWSPNGSFLLQKFSVRSSDGVLMEGTQRIGWDPQAKRIRSWIFDSEGGFGEGIWTRAGDEWIVQSQSVLKDGTSATSTRRLRRLGDDHIIVTMTSRVVDGELLPDIAVTMARKPPEPTDESE